MDWQFPFPVPQNTLEALLDKTDYPETALLKKPVGVPSKVQPSTHPYHKNSRHQLDITWNRRIAWLGSVRIPWPTKSWDIIKCHFKPLNFRVFCYAIINNQNTILGKVLYVSYSTPEINLYTYSYCSPG